MALSVFGRLADDRSECLFSPLFDADGSLKYICSSHLIMPLYSLRRLSALRPVAAFEQRVRTKQILLHPDCFCRSAEVGVQLFRLLQVQQTLTVRRIGKQYAHIAVIALGRVRALEKHRVGCTGLARVLDGQLHAVRIDVAADDIELASGWARSSALARLLPDRLCQSSSTSPHQSGAAGPGARRCAIMAASIAIVPEPQNGSRNGSRPRQRASDHSRRQRLTSGAALLLAR